MTSTGNYVAGMFLPFVFGGMFAAAMTATGASEIIGKYLISRFGARFAPYAIMGAVMLLALGGVSAFPFIIAPLAFSVLKAADLPRQILMELRCMQALVWVLLALLSVWC